MTTQEIKELIASKIAGQGSAVDAGSALPEILGGVVDLLKNQQDAVDLAARGFISIPDDIPVSELSQETLSKMAEAAGIYYQKTMLIRDYAISNIAIDEGDSTPLQRLISQAESEGITEDKGYYPIAIFSYGFGPTQDGWGNGYGTFLGVFYSNPEGKFYAVYFEI